MDQQEHLQQQKIELEQQVSSTPTSVDLVRVIASLKKQTENLQDSLQLIEERMSEYVVSTDIPLQLVKEKRRKKEELARLEAELAQVEAALLRKREEESSDILFTPFQASPETPYFVGRQAELAWLTEQITGTPASLIIGLSGLGGVGKTTLAIRLAHAMQDRFADGVLWANLDTTTSEEVLRAFAATFGQAEAIAEAPDLASKAALVRQILANKQVLVVLNNADEDRDQVKWDSERVKWLIPDGQQNTTLITTRSRMMLDNLGAVSLDLKPLAEADGLALLGQRLGQARVSTELEAARQVIQLVGGLPLALSIVAGYLARTANLRIAEYNGLLKNEQQRLDRLVDREIATRSVMTSFELSYNYLLDDSVKRLFASLSIFDGPDFSVEAVAAMADMLIVEAKLELGQLCDLSLVEAKFERDGGLPPDQPTSQERYYLHPLLKLFAQRKLGPEADTFRQQAATYFANLAQQYSQNGYDQLDLDWENIVGALRWACKHQQWSILVRGVQALTRPNLGVIGFMDARGHWGKASEILTWAAEGVDVLDDPLAKTAILTNLGAFALKRSDFEAATQHFQRSLALLDNVPQTVDASLQRAYLCEFMSRLMMQTDPEAALDWLQQGLAALENIETDAAKHQTGNLYILHSTLSGRMGNFPAAHEAAEKGLALLPATPNSTKISGLINLANLSRMSGNLEESTKYLKQGIEIARALNDVGRLAILRLNTGGVEAMRGQLSEATQHFEKALQLHQQIGDVYHAAGVHSNLGLTYLKLGDETQALHHLTAAIQLAETHELLEVEAMAKTNLVNLQIDQGQLEEATLGLSRAEEIYQQLKLTRELPETLRLQAKITLLEGDQETALILVDESLQKAQEGHDLLGEGIGWRIKGNILHAMQRFDQAETAYQTSLEKLAEQDPLELGKSRLALAQHYLENESEISESVKLLRDVLDTFKKLGIRRDIPLVRELLERHQP